MSNGAALIVGAGDATGGAIARAFAREGLTACVTRRARNLDSLAALVADIEAGGGSARAFGVDAREEDATVALIDQIEAEVGPLEVCVFNIGANVRFGITETTGRVYQKVWELAAFAGDGRQEGGGLLHLRAEPRPFARCDDAGVVGARCRGDRWSGAAPRQARGALRGVRRPPGRRDQRDGLTLVGDDAGQDVAQ